MPSLVDENYLQNTGFSIFEPHYYGSNERVF
jgi:hypothetical protein